MQADLESIAWRQLADYDAHRPGTIFADPSFRLTLREAYQVQFHVAGLRESRGESVAGYKVGCVSKLIQQQLGIAEPVFGHLFAGEMHRSGVSFEAVRYDNLAIEGELAFRAGAGAFAVIELHNYILRSPAEARAAELVACNAMQAGVVLPHEESACDEAQPISVLRNGVELGSSTVCAPHASVDWLRTQLKIFCKTLLPGQLVLTGSPLPLYRLEPGDRVEVRCGRLPPVTAVVNFSI